TMLSALSKANLATAEEVAAAGTREADALRQKVQALEPKSLEELVARPDYDFFSRVRWIILYVEAEPTPERLTLCREFVKKHMLLGGAGKEFLAQIETFLATGLSVRIWKSKWPKLFAN